MKTKKTKRITSRAYIIKIISLLHVIFLFPSCGKIEHELDSIYFNELDNKFIPDNYNEKKTILFKSNLDNEIKLEVIDYYFLHVEGGGEGILSIPQYSIHTLFVTLDFNIENCDTSNIKLRLAKISDEDIRIYVDIPKSCNSYRSHRLNSYDDYFKMEMDNLIYDKVIVISSSIPESIIGYSSIDKIYYDLNYGVVGFDSSSNNEKFRIVK